MKEDSLHKVLLPNSHNKEELHNKMMCVPLVESHAITYAPPYMLVLW